MGCFRRASDFQNRVSTAERVRHAFSGQRIRHPFAIHDEAVFVVAGHQSCFLPPVAFTGGMQGSAIGLPVVECSGKANGCGFRVFEFKVNRHPLQIRWPGCWGVVVIAIVFHIVGDPFGGVTINVGKSIMFTLIT